MKIIIKDENREKIEKIIDEMQKRAKTRTVSYQILKQTAEKETRRVTESYHATKKSMNGLIVKYMPDADNFPQAYKYRPEASWFRIEYGRNGLPYFTGCGRDYADRAANYREVETMPDDLTDAIKNAFMKGLY